MAKKYRVQTTCPQCGCSSVSHLSDEELQERFGGLPNGEMECSECAAKFMVESAEACPEWDEECKLKKG